MPPRAPQFRQRGVTYMVVMFLAASFAVMAMIVSEQWVTAKRRSAERELLFVGNQFREAIALYYQRTPGTLKRYPPRLEDLLLDNRHLGTMRYLRRIYADPLTGKPDWGTVKAPDGGIQGVYSRAEGKPIKQANFDDVDAALAGAARYADWQFIYEPPQAGVTVK